MAQKGIVTLTTDFGSKDPYVAQMKGVLLSGNPDVKIVDITHDIPNHDLLEAAFVIGSCFQLFPKFTLHVVVVDPGVGTKRKPILVRTETQYLMGPDNGVFSFVYEAEAVSQVWEMNSTHYFRSEVSETFHGRDIFASAAGWLSKGQNPEDFGEPLKNYTKLAVPKPQFADKTVKGLILHVDRFGNLITNVKLQDLYAHMRQVGARQLKVLVGGKEVPGLAKTYAEAGQGIVALAGSQGRLEIAAKERPAGALLGVSRGAEIQIVLG